MSSDILASKSQQKKRGSILTTRNFFRTWSQYGVNTLDEEEMELTLPMTVNW